MVRRDANSQGSHKSILQYKTMKQSTNQTLMVNPYRKELKANQQPITNLRKKITKRIGMQINGK